MTKLSYLSKGNFIGNPRGNLECGFAQPSLLYVSCPCQHVSVTYLPSYTKLSMFVNPKDLDVS